MLRHRTLVSVICLVTACSMPPFEYEGEHVVVATNVVEQVCAGTIDRLDLAVEHINEQLGWSQTDERVPVAILELSDAWKLCGSRTTACAALYREQPIAVLAPHQFEHAATHEVAHTRLKRRPSGGVPFFGEGIAVALAPASCRPDRVEQLKATELLMTGDSLDLGARGYYLGGELVTWLLDKHGPERVLSFLATLQRPDALTQMSEPEFVRASYRAHFGSEFDDDLHAHIRDPDQIAPEDLGCVAPEARWKGSRVHLQADLDCSSTRVQNNFPFPDRVYVDWTLEIPESETPRRYRLLGNIPDDTWLEIRPCTCSLHNARREVEWTANTTIGASAKLGPGTYLVRWHGALDGDAELDVVIESYEFP